LRQNKNFGIFKQYHDYSQVVGMKYSEFRENLNQGKIYPVYFFYGSEIYLIDEGLNLLLSRFVTANTASFNRDIFYGDDADGAHIINAALSVPMMAQYRVVVVKGFQRMAQSGKELILNYCRRPSPQTILVLLAEETDERRKIDLRKKYYSELKSFAQVIECKALYENQVSDFIRKFVHERSKSMQPRAVHLLQAKLGNSLRDLMNEVEKLVQFTRNKDEISEQDVEELVGIPRSFNIYELSDAIGEKKLEQGLFILRQMLEMGESPVYMVSSLTNHFLQLWRIRALKRQNVSDQDLTSQLHLPKFILDKKIKQAKNFSDQRIREILLLLQQADLNLKTSFQKPRLVMELLVFQIIQDNQPSVEKSAI